MSADAHAATPAVQADARIPALDGLRAIASLTVVFFHFFPHIARDWTSPFWALQRLPRRGEEGVTLFFVLSGFLISGILVNARASPRYFSTFYIRRAFRIFPLYYAVLAGYALTLAVMGTNTASLGRLLEPQVPLWTYVLYVQNFAMALTATYGATWMAGSWSLAIEEQFYFTLPAIVRFTTDRGLFFVAIAGLLLPSPLRALIQHFKFIPDLANKLLLPTAVDSLAAGILVMLAVRYRREWLTDRRRTIGWLAIVALAVWFAWPALTPDLWIRFYFLDPAVTSVACGLALLFMLIAPASGFARFLSRSWMRTLGNMAYSTYLFHPIFLCLSFQLLRGEDPILRATGDLLPIMVGLVATGVTSYASWTWFESALMKRGHRWKY